MLAGMKTLILALLHRIASRLRARWYLQLEYLALRHQVEVLKRSAKRPRFDPVDRGLWLLLSRWWPEWPQALENMPADTVRRWRRQGMWHHLRWQRGRKRPGRPPISAETRHLIREMSRNNRLWGAPRIHGELLKLGIKVSRTTVAKYIDRRSGPPSPTWRTFWRLHAPDFPVSEIYAELSGQLHAAYQRVIIALWHTIWRLAPTWQRLSHPTIPIIQADNADFKPIVQPLSGVEVVRAFGRSPPDCASSSIDTAYPLNLSIEMGIADVRLDAPVWKNRTPPPTTESFNPDDGNVQRSTVSEQAAA